MPGWPARRRNAAKSHADRSTTAAPASFTIDWYIQVTREALNLDQGGFNPESATLAGSSCVVRCSFARKFHSSGHINIQTRHITARASFILYFGAKLHLSRVQIFTPTDRRDILILSLCTPGLASLFPSLQRREFSQEIFARLAYLLRKKIHSRGFGEEHLILAILVFNSQRCPPPHRRPLAAAQAGDGRPDQRQRRREFPSSSV